jgi:VanZ family protein
MRWLAVAVILAVLVITSTVSLGYVHVFRPILVYVRVDDTVTHFAVMGALSAAVNLGFAEARPFGERLGIPLVTAWVVLGATLEELSQGYFPLRTVTLEDLVYSYMGILTAALGVALLRRLIPAR